MCVSAVQVRLDEPGRMLLRSGRCYEGERVLVPLGNHAQLSVGDAYPIAMAVKTQHGPVIKKVVQSVLVHDTPVMLVVNLAQNNFPVTGNNAERFALFGTPDKVTMQLAHLMRMSHDGASITWNDIAADVRQKL